MSTQLESFLPKGHIETNEILSISLLLIVNSIFISVFLLIYINRHSQIILNRCPGLLLISFFLIFIVSLINILERIVPFHYNHSCILFDYNKNITIYLIYLCYLMRSIRIRNIYKIDLNTKESMMTKEKFYIKTLFFIVILINIVYFIVYFFSNQSLYKTLYYKSLYCHVESDSSFSDLLPKGIIIGIGYIIKLILLFSCLFLVKTSIKKDLYKIKNEIFPVVTIFIVNDTFKVIFEYVFIVKNMIFYLKFVFFIYEIIVFVSIMLISGLNLLILSRKNKKIPISNTVETIEDFDLLVLCKYTLTLLYKFLSEKGLFKERDLLMKYLQLLIIEEKLVSANELLVLKNLNSYDSSLFCFDGLEENMSIIFPILNKEYKEFISKKTEESFDFLMKEANFHIKSMYFYLKNEVFLIFKESSFFKIGKSELEKEEIIFCRLCAGVDLNYRLIDIDY